MTTDVLLLMSGSPIFSDKLLKWGTALSLGLIGMGIVGLGVGWLATSSPNGLQLPPVPGGLANNLSWATDWMRPGNPPGTLFKTGDLTQEAARQRYHQGLEQLKNQDFAGAAQTFESLLPVYPGLEAFIRWHLAEAHQQLGNEGPVQQHLNTLLKHVYTPFSRLVELRLAESLFRGNQAEQARPMFQKLYNSSHHNATTYWGSAYYLGLMALQTDQPMDEVLTYWQPYLASQCLSAGESGRFCWTMADSLAKRHDTLSPELKGQVASILAQSQVWDRALPLFEAAPMASIWQAKGMALLQSGQPHSKADGLICLYKGLPYAKTLDSFQEALDTVLKTTPPGEHVALLQGLLRQRLKFGQDYTLWRLAQLQPNQASALFGKVVSVYPKSPYAPDSSWRLIRPKVLAGDWAAIIQMAPGHLNNYPQGRSAPKVQFWLARAYEGQGNQPQAIKAYQRLLKNYPRSYYAFRAHNRLLAHQRHQPDAGWSITQFGAITLPDAHRLITQPPDWPRVSDVVLDQSHLNGAQREWFQQASQELFAIGAPDDALLLWQSQYPDPDDAERALIALQAWAWVQQDQAHLAVKTLRDAITDDGVHERPKTNIESNTATLQWIYAPWFWQDLAPLAQSNGLTPAIAQALMREESYFNPRAVSTSRALGLMQLLPSTANEVAHQIGLDTFQEADLFNPKINLQLGCHYLGGLFKSFEGNGMLAVPAYNAGPGAMRRFQAANPMWQKDPDRFVEAIPYAEARLYIEKVYESFWNYARLYGKTGE